MFGVLDAIKRKMYLLSNINKNVCLLFVLELVCFIHLNRAYLYSYGLFAPVTYLDPMTIICELDLT